VKLRIFGDKGKNYDFASISLLDLLPFKKGEN